MTHPRSEHRVESAPDELSTERVRFAEDAACRTGIAPNMSTRPPGAVLGVTIHRRRPHSARDTMPARLSNFCASGSAADPEGGRDPLHGGEIFDWRPTIQECSNTGWLRIAVVARGVDMLPILGAAEDGKPVGLKVEGCHATADFAATTCRTPSPIPFIHWVTAICCASSTLVCTSVICCRTRISVRRSNSSPIMVRRIWASPIVTASRRVNPPTASFSTAQLTRKLFSARRRCSAPCTTARPSSPEASRLHDDDGRVRRQLSGHSRMTLRPAGPDTRRNESAHRHDIPATKSHFRKPIGRSSALVLCPPP
jgi:hypothetical protein